MQMTKHTDAIDWPNGAGYTPCTREYAEAMDQRDAIYDANHDRPERTLEDLSPEDYEAWHRLDQKLSELRHAGHMGEPVRF